MYKNGEIIGDFQEKIKKERLIKCLKYLINQVNNTNMKKKRYLITTINFGKEGDMSRNIIERLLEKHKDISKVVRQALIAYFSTAREFTDVKIQNLLNERKNLKQKIPDISEQLAKLEEQLNKLGYKLKDEE